MALQSLTPPQDITWTRLGYSRDMIDTNFGDLNFPPKWRTSMTVYSYIVPEEETVDAYPNSRIIYLKLSCSITGYNPNEDLLEALKIAEEQDKLDDLQRSIWEVIQSKGWAEKYWPCLGAIMQVAVYPNQRNGVSPDDYPYIIDFEPKKRELFEHVSEGSEVLSASAENISVSKGNTNTQSVELKTKAGFNLGFVGASAELTAGASWQQVNNRTTDTLQEDRTTKSHSTSFSQMYQLFNGYHLGTNRALFLVNPRPHTGSSVSDTETKYSLINGERRLEGIQDMFIVVNLPRIHDGFCIQAGIDTAHKVTESSAMYLALKMNDNQTSPDWDDDLPPNDPPPPLPPNQQVDHLVITRRVIQGCGIFDENGNFQVQKVPDVPVKPPVVTGEFLAPDLPRTLAMYRSVNNPELHGEIKVRLAHELNIRQSRISKSMMDSYTAGNYKPRSITETSAFKSLVASAIVDLDVSVRELVSLKYITSGIARKLSRYKIFTVGDLFKESSESIVDVDINAIRKAIIK